MEALEIIIADEAITEISSVAEVIGEPIEKTPTHPTACCCCIG